jgi:hypothetical protein
MEERQRRSASSSLTPLARAFGYHDFRDTPDLDPGDDIEVLPKPQIRLLLQPRFASFQGTQPCSEPA